MKSCSDACSRGGARRAASHSSLVPVTCVVIVSLLGGVILGCGQTRARSNRNALGLIGLEWISDKDDSTSNSFLARIKVMSVAGDSAHFKPYQAYLALKYYPLARKITILSREARWGLGGGFMAFFASERGQRIVLKAGLVPVTMPLRVVEIDRRSFDIEN